MVRKVGAGDLHIDGIVQGWERAGCTTWILYRLGISCRIHKGKEGMAWYSMKRDQGHILEVQDVVSRDTCVVANSFRFSLHPESQLGLKACTFLTYISNFMEQLKELDLESLKLLERLRRGCEGSLMITHFV